MHVKRPSISDSKRLRAALKQKGIVDLHMKKLQWNISIHVNCYDLSCNISSTLIEMGYDLESEVHNIIYVYIPKNMKVQQ